MFTDMKNFKITYSDGTNEIIQAADAESEGFGVTFYGLVTPPDSDNPAPFLAYRAHIKAEALATAPSVTIKAIDIVP